ncbi:MAG: hypothetical protein ACO24Z_08510, partial [Arenimonas sp.]
TKNKILASGMYREKALRKLQNGKTKEAIVSAETSRDLIVGLLEESDKSPLLVAELAKSALILGSAQMADGQAGPAKNTWAETATLLDGQTIRIFDFTPLRRLLAMNLGEAEKAMVMESELSKAAYKDPRYAPEPTTSGTAVPSVPTPNLSKEN